MSLKITLPEKGSLPFIVPDKAEQIVREVHVNWRSPDEQLEVKIEKIRDEGEAEPESIEEILKRKTKEGLKPGKSYLRKLKFKKQDIPAELTIKSVVNNSISYEFTDLENKVILLTKTEEEFLELIQKYNPK